MKQFPPSFSRAIRIMRRAACLHYVHTQVKQINEMYQGIADPQLDPRELFIMARQHTRLEARYLRQLKG